MIGKRALLFEAVFAQKTFQHTTILQKTLEAAVAANGHLLVYLCSFWVSWLLHTYEGKRRPNLCNLVSDLGGNPAKLSFYLWINMSKCSNAWLVLEWYRLMAVQTVREWTSVKSWISGIHFLLWRYLRISSKETRSWIKSSSASLHSSWEISTSHIPKILLLSLTQARYEKMNAIEPVNFKLNILIWPRANVSRFRNENMQWYCQGCNKDESKKYSLKPLISTWRVSKQVRNFLFVLNQNLASMYPFRLRILVVFCA